MSLLVNTVPSDKLIVLRSDCHSAILSMMIHKYAGKIAFRPTHFQVIFKSCKLIPVMIGSVLILGKRYSVMEVFACVCMSVGLIWFTLADSNIQPQFSVTGEGVCSTRLFVISYLFSEYLLLDYRT